LGALSHAPPSARRPPTQAGARLKPRDEDGTALDNAIKHRSAAGDYDRCIELLNEAMNSKQGRLEVAPQDEDEQEIS